eukprot:SAG11_NODE_598_length_8269_cov_17.002448_3_plen_79_part_00
MVGKAAVGHARGDTAVTRHWRQKRASSSYGCFGVTIIEGRAIRAHVGTVVYSFQKIAIPENFISLICRRSSWSLFFKL